MHELELEALRSINAVFTTFVYPIVTRFVNIVREDASKMDAETEFKNIDAGPAGSISSRAINLKRMGRQRAVV